MQIKPGDIVGDTVRTARVMRVSPIYCGGRACTVLAWANLGPDEDERYMAYSRYGTSKWVVWTAWLTDGVWELIDRQEVSWTEPEVAYTAYWHRAGWAFNG